jgi:hypothetical protein
MDFLRFKQSVNILKLQLPADLLLNRVVLQEQQVILLTEKDRLVQETRRVNINGYKTNQSLSGRVTQIQNGELADHIANLRAQQQRNITSTVSLLTISRIVEKNREIERLEKSQQNNALLIEKRARILLKVMQDIESIVGEITLVDDCILVSDFLILENITPTEVAEYDLGRLYNVFNLGV